VTSPQHPSPSEAGDSAATSLSLLGRLKGNEPDAWERLILLYAPLVYHWCRRQKLPEQEIADVFQEVFQAVSLKICGFQKDRPGDTFRGWLRVITRNKVYDHFRRAGREPVGAGGNEAQEHLCRISESDDCDSIDDAKECNELLYRALENIRVEFTPRTWQAFWKVTVDGKSPAEVAQELAMQVGAIRVAKSRVLQRLRRELGE
jgi:RNA polymerase sigma-70 factor (ECF subfamily)